MNNRFNRIAGALMVGGAMMFLATPLRAADNPTSSTTPPVSAEVKQLLKDRDEAMMKARVAEQKMKEAGVKIDSLGFDTARATRDKQAATPGAKQAAYAQYVKTAKELEKKVQGEVQQGKRAAGFNDIARYERLQAEVDLAEVDGRLPKKGAR